MYCFTPVGRGEYLFVGEQIPIKINSRNLPQIVGRTAEAALPLGQGSGRLAGRWCRGPVPEGGRYGKGQGGGFLSSERPGAEL